MTTQTEIPKLSSLSPEQRRALIAGACGFKVKWYATGRCRKVYNGVVMPDYITSLDAMHLAEQTLTYDQQPYYIEALKKVMMNEAGVSEFDVCHATPEHRSGAFLIATGRATL